MYLIIIKGNRSDLDTAISHLKAGGIERVALECPRELVKYPRGLSYLSSLYARPKNDYQQKEVYLLYGPPGTRKTSWAFAYYPDAFVVPPASSAGWVDGWLPFYQEALIDDYDPIHQYPRQQLLRMLDGWPCQVPIKGGFTWFRPKVVIITSNFTPEELFADETYLKAFKRRCTGWLKFTEVNAYTVVHGKQPSVCSQ